MERAFWHALEACAEADGVRPVDIVGAVDAARENALSRALRVYLLKRARDLGPGRLSGSSGAG